MRVLDASVNSEWRLDGNVSHSAGRRGCEAPDSEQAALLLLQNPTQLLMRASKSSGSLLSLKEGKY